MSAWGIVTASTVALVFLALPLLMAQASRSGRMTSWDERVERWDEGVRRRAAEGRIGGQVEVRAGGRTAVETESAPLREDTLFRIASIAKPMGGALTLSLVQDGALALDNPIARWLPEVASPRVLVAPDAPLDRTTEARRPIIIRHLLTMTAGWGAVLEETPLQKAMMER